MKLLLIDDHAVLREALRQMLEAVLAAELRGAASAVEALAALDDWTPDAVLLDLGLPGTGGLTLLPQLVSRGLRVLVLTMQHEAIYASRALAAGALGYVSKNAAPQELLAAIAAVAAGRHYIEPRIAQDLALRRVEAGDRFQKLTQRDLEILRQLGAGRTMTEIAGDLGLSYKTVANTASQIRAKLGVSRTADLIRLAVQMPLAPPSAIDAPATTPQ